MDLLLVLGLFLGLLLLMALIVAGLSTYGISKPTTISREPPIPPRKQVEKKNHPKPILSTQGINQNIWIEEIIDSLNENLCLSDLLIIKEVSNIFYGDLLKCVEWKFKRLRILLRDNYQCIDCNSRSLSNHVHHNYYLRHELPWDIDDNALETLCYNCHKKRHESETIPVYLKSGAKLIEVSREDPKCSRCGGTGYISQFSHVQNGICFKCMGDLINRSVFSSVLDKTYKNLNSYNENAIRIRYETFFNNISITDFINKVPNYKNYKTLPKSTFQIEDNYDEYLPF